MSEGEGQAEGVDNAEGEGAGDALGPEQGGADGHGARGLFELGHAGLEGVVDLGLKDAALACTQACLDAGEAPLQVIEGKLLPKRYSTPRSG